METNSQNQTPSPGSYGGPYIFALLVTLGLIGVGSYMAAQHIGYTLLGAGLVSLVALLVTWPVAAAVDATRRAADMERAALQNIVTERLQQIATLLTTMSEQQLLSDRAKAVAFRDNDREALRRAIREEMGREDWDAALVLANEMETQFGYTQEAATLRAEISNHRLQVFRKQITESVTLIDQHTRGERWSQALREAEQLMQMYPKDEQVQKLPQEIEARRQGHKKQLLESWKEAVARKDVDGSIEILKKLDSYLTPVEAESMQEMARGIFKEKLGNLKAQFSQAVHEEKWHDALRIGESISREFPNSRIALEVRDMMEVLRQRAGTHAEVARA